MYSLTSSGRKVYLSLSKSLSGTSHLLPFTLVLTVRPLSDEEEQLQRVMAAPAVRDKIRSGVSKSQATVPVVRLRGPLAPIFSVDGQWLSQDDERHPYGPKPGRRCATAWMES